ncbi:MAG: radical SAM protein [Thermoguttaceae bacterium]|nr:radical SAM protein [Thermoguttaceae bacterium]
MELTQFHPSYFQNFRYVYPVVSRRANGVSIGVNLSPSKRCNFRCVYCQVDRSQRGLDAAVDVDLMRRELEAVARTTVSGDLFRCERFVQTPENKRVLRDFAFSGDGEPTLAPEFGAAVDAMIDVRKTLSLDDVKLTLITNATTLAEPRVADALDRLAANNGEIWAKLDGGDAGSPCSPIRH